MKQIFCLLIVTLFSVNQLNAATSSEVQNAVTNIQAKLITAQKYDGRWQGTFETTPMTDALMLAYGKFLKIDTSLLRADALKAIDAQYDRQAHAWPEAPHGIADETTTQQIVGALTYAGEETFLANRGMSRFPNLSKSKAKKMSWLARMQLAPLGIIPMKALPPAPLGLLKLQSGTGFRWPKLGTTGRGILAYTLWYNLTKAINQNRVEELTHRHGKLIAKTLKAIIDTEGRDGTWYFLTETLLSLATLEAAERAGMQSVTDIPLRSTIEKSWAGLIDWRARTQAGTLSLQPMLSSVWDTALISVALSESNENKSTQALKNARDWLVRNQLVYPKTSPLLKENGNGGWSFHHEDLAYPDVDDATAVLGSLMMIDHQIGDRENDLVFQNGLYWVLSRQNRDGGFPVFTRDVPKWPMTLATRLFGIENLYEDSSQADITARVVIMLNHLQQDSTLRDRLGVYFTTDAIEKAADRSCEFLDHSSESVTGADLPLWHGDWFRNYIYGTSFVIQAYLRPPCHKQISEIAPYLNWFIAQQNDDGGWGEGSASYASHTFSKGPSALETTAFAMIPLLDYLHTQTPDLKDPMAKRAYKSVERGVEYFLKQTGQGRNFTDPSYLAVIFKDHWYGQYSYVPTYGMLHILMNWQALQMEMQGHPAPPRL